MSNGVLIKMGKGTDIRTFWLFEEGKAKEYTQHGLTEIACEFTTLYNQLRISGWAEI